MRKIKWIVVTTIMTLLTSCCVLGLSACKEDKEPTGCVGHNWGEPTTITAATCMEDGEQTFVCQDCGKEETQIIEATGHVSKSYDRVEPTCTAVGYSGGTYCSVCKEELTKKTTLNMLDHIEATPATCMTKAVCKVCNKEYGEKLTDHCFVDTQIEIPAREATCETAGWDTYHVCGVCTYTQYKEIKAFGHDTKCENPNSKKATCISPAYCGVCKQDISYDGVPDKLHDTKCDNVNSRAATCVSRPYCGVCRNYYGESLGHDTEFENKKSLKATCTESAYCGVCERAYGAPLGHDTKFENKNSKAATCTESAYCGVCKTSYGANLGHVELLVKGKAVSCTEDGWDDYIKCRRCGGEVTEKVVYPKLKHKNFTSYNLVGFDGTTMPTCTTPGQIAGKKCCDCGEIVRNAVILAPLDHDNGQRKALVLVEYNAELDKDVEVYVKITKETTTPSLYYDINDVKVGVVSGVLDGHGLYYVGANAKAVGQSVLPGCITAGFCGDCGKNYELNGVGHKLESLTNCLLDRNCTVDGCAYVEPGEAEHKSREIIPGKAATCTEAGLTQGEKCTHCGTITIESTVIAAGCNQDGIIAAIEGKTHGAYCTRCGEISLPVEDIEEHTHSYENGNCTVGNCDAHDPNNPAHTFNANGQCIICGQKEN